MLLAGVAQSAATELNWVPLLNSANEAVGVGPTTTITGAHREAAAFLTDRTRSGLSPGMPRRVRLKQTVGRLNIESTSERGALVKTGGKS